MRLVVAGPRLLAGVDLEAERRKRIYVARGCDLEGGGVDRGEKLGRAPAQGGAVVGLEQGRSAERGEDGAVRALGFLDEDIVLLVLIVSISWLAERSD